jgi:hypothetical protein
LIVPIVLLLDDEPLARLSREYDLKKLGFHVMDIGSAPGLIRL